MSDMCTRVDAAGQAGSSCQLSSWDLSSHMLDGYTVTYSYEQEGISRSWYDYSTRVLVQY